MRSSLVEELSEVIGDQTTGASGQIVCSSIGNVIREDTILYFRARIYGKCIAAGADHLIDRVPVDDEELQHVDATDIEPGTGDIVSCVAAEKASCDAR